MHEDGDQYCYDAVADDLRLSYQHIDTAHIADRTKPTAQVKLSPPWSPAA